MKRKRVFIITSWLVLSLLYLLPMVDLSGLHLAVIRGDDYPFHFARIFSAIEQLNTTGHIQPIARFGEHDIFYGANIFYPTLTTVLPIALISMIVHSVISSVYVYLFLVNLLTFFIAYRCADYISQLCFPKENNRLRIFAPYVFSFFYVFSHYRMICFYQRFDLGEFFVLTLYPLVFAGFYSILKDKGLKKHWLIIGLSLIAYSHLLSLMLVVVVLAVLFLVSLIRKNITINMFKQFLFSAVMTGLLSIGALLPIVYEMLTFPIRSVSVHDLAREASGLGTMLVTSSVNYLNYMSIGLILLCSLVVGVYQVIWKKDSVIRHIPLLKQSLILSLVFMIMMTTLFPWRLLQHTPLSIIQFPFRLMPFLTIFGSFLGASLLADYLSQVKGLSVKKMTIGLSVGVVILSTISVNVLMIHRSLDRLMFSKHDVVVTERYQKSVNKDYFPARLSSDQTKRIRDKIGLINQREVSMPYSFDKDTAVINVTIKEKITSVETPIIGYSGLIVRDETGKKIKSTLSSSRTLVVLLSKGRHQLTVSYEPPLAIKYSGIISSLVALCYGFYLVKTRKKDLPCD
ncbi:hypothetical protein ACWN6Y_06590 [Vagococcus teuberi]|uniref:Membrane protein 6-pyruvoyl-tetrahydropterin synthase-related domain-containing protein n=1 Tax=Vagococcus teuberi TaxID=519472 RepID=A0A1J0A5I9_9ENTE|nr:hypothetical protein [Vagococcus teuberi]APB31205.1 hypothetical protein BHY08_04795 [Vagococcus teuberi]